MRYAALALMLVNSSVMAAADNETGEPAGNAASRATVTAQAKAGASLPAEDGRDAEFSGQGFVATLTEPTIRNAAGKIVWNLNAYDFVEGASPDTVNPSLWRHMSLLRKHGLFKVADNVWQVRGFDVSNMTIIKGETGWILIDPLTTREMGAAALKLVNEQLGPRPVSAVIYSHSHADHFGGVRGVIDASDAKSGKVKVIAPEHFLLETASENVIAGPSMTRRSNYQFGSNLSPGVLGQMGSGIGAGISAGEITLVTPNDEIHKTGDIRVLDGVTLEFQMAPNSEAPAEMNIYVPAARTFLAAEIATCSLHNILTPRGAKVRDTLAWAGYLHEAVNLYAGRSDAIISSHCWPRFGAAEVKGWLSAQRDNYRFLHDQTVRLMNQGLTQTEIAEQLKAPPVIADQWFNHGYYGTYSHNSKAIYQYYLGWYDAVPANLNPHPPAARGARFVAALGGARRVMALAKKAMAVGDYRWSSDLLNQLVFADPQNNVAKSMLADSYEQQGFQAESAIWRNMFLSAASDLRGTPKTSSTSQNLDMIAAIPTGMLMNSLATRLNPDALGSKQLQLNFVMSDRKETVKISIGNAVLFADMAARHDQPMATVTGPRQLFLGMLFLKMPVAQMEAAGLKIEGDRDALDAMLAAIDPQGGPFNIAEP
jgi:alkyl sulfatase BDS1-like metallo-beta-lactamase superfamily hydrolase